MKVSRYLEVEVAIIVIQMTSILVMTRWSGDKKTNITGAAHENLLSLTFGFHIDSIDLNDLITQS